MFSKMNDKLFFYSHFYTLNKCLFGQRPRMASKLYMSVTPVSVNGAKTFLEK